MPAHAQYLRRALVEHVSPSMVRISVNSSRPMRQVVEGISQTYGLLIDYEEPPFFSSYDVDITNRAWRAKHPNAKPYLGMSGGGFTSDFPEIVPARLDTSAKIALEKITADYNRSNNPGRFTVRIDGPHRLSVVGTSMRDQNGRQIAAHALLDTHVNVSGLRQGNAEEILEALCVELTKASGLSVAPGIMPLNMMIQTRVNLDTGSDVSSQARKVLIQISKVSRYSLVWSLNWDPNQHFYVLNLTTAIKLEKRPDGTLQLVPLKLD
jgi:hypothetical protein